jgi:hypothetical protein
MMVSEIFGRSERIVMHEFPVGSYRTWIDEYLVEPQKRKLALGALDAFERLENATSISNSEIVPILEAAECRFVRVWEIGAHLLSKLAAKHSAAQEALLIMLRNRKAEVRFQSIALLGGSSIPPSFAAHLIRLALRDKSYQVRGKVAEAACQLGLTEMLPDLQESLDAEKHPIARQALEFAVALLRDGYLLQRHGGKLTNVWVRREREHGYAISVPITDDDLKAGKLDSIIADAKAMLTHARDWPVPLPI